MKKFIYKVEKDEVLLHSLAEKSCLSKQKLKDALNFGAVQVKKHDQKKYKKIRRSTFHLEAGDEVHLYYDEKILSLKPLSDVICLYENRDIGIWIKPAGALSQGTHCADHTSLLRYIEKKKKEVFLVHRLDRETVGIMLVAYTKKAAAYYSEQFSKNKMVKKYQAWVYDPENSLPEKGVIDFPLEGKEAKTSYQKLKNSSIASLVEIELHTGRLHQIRKHFSLLGHAVMGDPLYGKGNKDDAGLQLVAYHLEVPSMGAKRPQLYSIDPSKYLASFA